MTCVICKVELVEEVSEVTPDWYDPSRRAWISGAPIKEFSFPTGYQYCPSCGLVYKEIK